MLHPLRGDAAGGSQPKPSSVRKGRIGRFRQGGSAGRPEIPADLYGYLGSDGERAVEHERVEGDVHVPHGPRHHDQRRLVALIQHVDHSAYADGQVDDDRNHRQEYVELDSTVEPPHLRIS